MSMTFFTKQSVARLFGVLSFATLASASSLQTYEFQFYGIETSVNNPSFQQVINGGGTFSFTSAATTITQSDLTAFSASGIFNPGHGPGFGSWNFGLSDLTTFSFAATPRSLTLTTVPVLGISPLPYNTTLFITGLGPNQVFLSQGSGAITSLTATPEPATYALLGLGGVLCLLRRIL